MNNNEEHSSLVRSLRLHIGNLPGVVLWPNNSGYAKYESSRGKKFTVPYGLVKGCADLVGILAPNGRWVALEVKTGKGELSDEQALFIALVRRMGGFAAVVHSLDEGLAAIERARSGESE